MLKEVNFFPTDIPFDIFLSFSFLSLIKPFLLFLTSPRGINYPLSVEQLHEVNELLDACSFFEGTHFFFKKTIKTNQLT